MLELDLLLVLFPHVLQDHGHLLTLPLGADVGADALLQELQAPEKRTII